LHSNSVRMIPATAQGTRKPWPITSPFESHMFGPHRRGLNDLSWIAPRRPGCRPHWFYRMGSIGWCVSGHPASMPVEYFSCFLSLRSEKSPNGFLFEEVPHIPPVGATYAQLFVRSHQQYTGQILNLIKSIGCIFSPGVRICFLTVTTETK